jgi:two-component system, sensor histidine kinase and response regulator
VARYYHREAAAMAPAELADTAVPVSSPADALPVVDGLNTTEGLQRVAGNAKLYLKLLRQFAADEHDAAQRIRQLLLTGDRATAERVAHTIKGVAGNLGVHNVHAAAADLERASREGAATDTLCDRLASALAPLVAAVRTGTPEPSAAPPAGQLSADPVVISTAVTRMGRCLAEFDPAAAEYLESDHSTFSALFDAATLAQFEQHIGSYAFADAKVLLADAALARGISLTESSTS